ncbi:MAG: peptide chain release factor N(5)-glutamine methyltransferase [Firmicutes bacterium]|nr:peptide chain release factor N(5)-glutamine methyltransferase [Bacillota bacterium]
MNKQQLWRQAAERLNRLGKADARFEAELLLRSALGEDRARFFATLDEAVDPAVLAQFSRWLEQRASGVPLQYIVGRQEFMGLDFKVTPAVLIPRPDTEIAVEVALEVMDQLEAPLVADIATGSGAIAVALAYHQPRARVWATDISPEALAVAQDNARQNGVSQRITFLQGAWGAPLREHGLTFNCIVSNPPYIASQEIDELAIEVQKEPRLALDGGPDGLDCYRALVPQAWDLLRPGGYLILEVGMGQAPAVAALLEQHRFTHVSTRRDLAGIERVVNGRKD